MNTTTVLLSVLIVVACATCGVAIWALVEAVKTLRSVRTLSDDLDVRVMPLLDKVDVSVDALNAELLRIDAIVTQFEEISERVESTTRTVQDVANAPVEIVTDLADRVRRAWRGRKSAQHEGYGPVPEASGSEAPETPWVPETPDAPETPEVHMPEQPASDQLDPDQPDA